MEGMMEANKRLEFLSPRSDSATPMPGHETWLPPWIFKHEDLVQALESAQKLGQDALTNTINHIHFTEGLVRVLSLQLAKPSRATGKLRIFPVWISKGFSLST
jgi:hypothetical protein